MKDSELRGVSRKDETEAVRPPSESADEKSVTTLVGEIGSAVKDLVEGETRLAIAEFRENARDLSKHAIIAGFAGGTVLLGFVPLAAFLVLGLARLIDGNYWLSSLVVAVVYFAAGACASVWAYRKIRNRDLTFPRTRDSLERDKEMAKETGRNISDSLQRRAS